MQAGGLCVLCLLRSAALCPCSERVERTWGTKVISHEELLQVPECLTTAFLIVGGGILFLAFKDAEGSRQCHCKVALKSHGNSGEVSVGWKKANIMHTCRTDGKRDWAVLEQSA